VDLEEISEPAPSQFNPKNCTLCILLTFHLVRLMSKYSIYVDRTTNTDGLHTTSLESSPKAQRAHNLEVHIVFQTATDKLSRVIGSSLEPITDTQTRPITDKHALIITYYPKRPKKSKSKRSISLQHTHTHIKVSFRESRRYFQWSEVVRAKMDKKWQQRES
jgi:hypothetical protein